MHPLIDNLKEYAQTVTGEVPELETFPEAQISKLPLFIRSRYQWYSARFFGQRCLLAIATDGEATDRPTPADYANQAATIADTLGADHRVVFVLHTIPAFVRNRLVHAGVPFIVPGTQMFLPQMFVDLRENFPRSRPTRAEKLVTSAQVIVLYQLTHGGLDGLSQQAIAERIGYSAMMVSHARDALTAHGLCELVKSGRAITLNFPLPARELWERARESMSSPIQNTEWVIGSIPDQLRCRAGVSALSASSMLSEDELPTYAIFHKTFASLVERGVLRPCPLAEEADAQVEIWKYDPLLLAGETGQVDPFSLSLSLENSSDERVEEALDEMMGAFAW